MIKQIKNTTSKFRTHAEDQHYAENLQQSTWMARNLIIVCLFRNEIGKNENPVRPAPEIFGIDSNTNPTHLARIINGKLANGRNPINPLFDAPPINRSGEPRRNAQWNSMVNRR